MPASRSFCICRHQWLRVVRLGSTIDTLVGLVSKGGVLIGLLLIGAAFLIVLPEETRRVIVGEGLSAFLADYLFVVGAVTLMVNMWLSGRGSPDLFAYRFYPISLAGLSVVIQIGRALHIRYLTLGTGVIITVALISPHLPLAPLVFAGLFILLLDASALLLHALHAKTPWIFYSITVAITGAILFDLFGGHVLSILVFDGWMGSTDVTSYPLLVPVGIAYAALGASHRRIRTLLRYGS